ncbi:KxYKxGKxW signal peptide domain-containing protein [Limosilactobacillus sp. c9Ua_26_M]|uniref:KxYKxGKxW signal peptide domain-containing protein n=1 Tax=Limosilactobacillus urinaemulieris TaxID=2742600 RepID=A0ABR8ZK54_9LACO|nr:MULTISPECIES: KxYKxGKxW signal peptide domain-containing protein [Limosilactobacillus]MBD8085685.1 KxYKxGKxW signal peptide domain-containing protein [Limosilactobacillus urinaemulieris]
MKKHFKLYKAGKLWLTAAISVLGIAATSTVANAQTKVTNYAATEAMVAAQPANENNNVKSNASQNSETATSSHVNSADKTVTSSAPASPTSATKSEAPANPSQTTISKDPTSDTSKTDEDTNKLVKKDDGKYYVNNQLANGLLPNGTSKSYFKDGVMQTGVQEIDGKLYNFNDKGYLSSGYVSGKGYFGDNGQLISSKELFQQKNGKWYYKGNIAQNKVDFDGSSYYFKDGEKQTGIISINGTNYYFDPNNQGKLGTGYVQQDGKWYYFGKDGKQVSVDALVVQNDKYYYQGKVANGYITTKNGAYYFKDGVKQTGIIDADNGMKYYMNKDGQGITGYVQDKNGNYYMFDEGGKVVSGAYNWQGSIYYFDPVTHLRVDNTYVATEKDGRGLLLGKNGIALSGVYLWYGSYYAFDYKTHLRVDNNFFTAQWGLQYYFKDNGQIASGLTNINGDMYYFDPSSFLMVKNNYIATQRDGRGVLLGNDGKALTGVQKWMGTFYYFDPTTYLRVDNDYREQVWQDGTHDWYMFGNNGQIISGFYNWQGSLYYFNPVTYLKVTNHYIRNTNGVIYQANKDGQLTQVPSYMYDYILKYFF